VAGKADPNQLESLGRAIGRPTFRKAFELDPFGALERVGIKPEGIPPETLDLLADLEPWELEVLGRVSQRASRIPELEKVADHVGVIIH
jgi:hypothetical protein